MVILMKTPPTTSQYSRLQEAYDHFNQSLFESKLPPCLINMQRKKGSMGYFSRSRFIDGQGGATDEIALNPEFFGNNVIIEVMQTLVHEMCHLWQFQFGDPGRRAYHNKEWAAKMESLGLMPSDTGEPGGKKTGEHMGDYPIPDGLFLQSVQSLLDDQFSIPYADRCSVAATALLAPSEGIMEGEGGEPTGSKPKDRSKIKYTCPTCSINVWGKPGLHLGCIDCEAVLVPI